MMVGDNKLGYRGEGIEVVVGVGAIRLETRGWGGGFGSKIRNQARGDSVLGAPCQMMVGDNKLGYRGEGIEVVVGVGAIRLETRGWGGGFGSKIRNQARGDSVLGAPCQMMVGDNKLGYRGEGIEVVVGVGAIHLETRGWGGGFGSKIRNQARGDSVLGAPCQMMVGDNELGYRGEGIEVVVGVGAIRLETRG
jgi:hypothetical protein